MPVRDARPEDIEEICALIEEHARFEGKDDLSLDRKAMAGHLFGQSPKAWVLIAESNPAGSNLAESNPAESEIAGFAFCSWNFSTWEGKPGIWLDDLFIRPRYRRSGLGGDLLRTLRSRTDGRIEWDMHEGNDRAAAFYANLGAEPVPGWIRYRWPAPGSADSDRPGMN